MLQQESAVLRIIVAFLNILSIIGCSVILWTFFKTPRMSKNPGVIIQRIAIAQICCSLQLMFAQFYYDQEQNYTPSAAFIISPVACDVLGFFQILIETQYLLYNLFFVTNLYFSLTLQQYNFTKFFQFVELGGFAFSSIISIISATQNGIGIGLMGQCSFDFQEFQLVLGFILATALLVLFLVVILIGLKKSHFQNKLYNTEIQKFKFKYQKQFITINILYSVIFILINLFPDIVMLVCYFVSSTLNIGQTFSFILLLILSLQGILLLIIRLNDPLVWKYVKKSLIKKKELQLKEKLLINSNSQTEKQDENAVRIMSNQNRSQERSLEFTYFQGNHEVLRVIKTHHNSIENAENSSQSTPKSIKNSQFSILKNQQELFIIILAIKEDLLQNHEKSQTIISQFVHYHFNFIKKYQLNLKFNNTDLDQILNQSTELPKFSDFIQKENPIRVINCFSYANQILFELFSSLLNINEETILKSLSFQKNQKKIKQQLLNQTQYGTVFISHDNQISIDIISKNQKILLTKGGGLLNISKRWYEESQTNGKQTGSLLPLILGLYSIQMDENRCVNVLLRINTPKIDIPLSQELWDTDICLEQLLKRNVFGWIQVNPKEIQRKFIAKNIYDGEYQIQLNANDLKLSDTAQSILLNILRKDLPSLNFVNNFTLTFIYFKFDNKRLNSIVQHQEAKEQQYQLIQLPKSQSQAEQCITLQVGNALKCIGQFELDCKLGYVKVFFDDLWEEEYTYINQEGLNSLYERLIELVTEII